MLPEFLLVEHSYQTKSIDETDLLVKMKFITVTEQNEFVLLTHHNRTGINMLKNKKRIRKIPFKRGEELII